MVFAFPRRRRGSNGDTHDVRGLHVLLEVDFDGALALEPGSLWCESIENHLDLIAASYPLVVPARDTCERRARFPGRMREPAAMS